MVFQKLGRPNCFFAGKEYLKLKHGSKICWNMNP
jgi:hypothetical protein